MVADAEFAEAEPGSCSVRVGVLVPPGFECGVSSRHHHIKCREFAPELIGEGGCGISDPLAQYTNVDLPESFAEDVDRA